MRAVRGVMVPVLVVVAAALSGCSDVVRLPDCVDCRPVEMTVGETLEIELGGDRSVTNDPEAYRWVVTDTGSMQLVSEDRGTRPEDESEFIGGYSPYVIYHFEPTAVGSTQLRFEFLPAEDPGGRPGNSLDITVIVNE